MKLVPRKNLAYFQGSIGIFCVVLGVSLSGGLRLIDPAAVAATSALNQLPQWIQTLVNISWVFSGLITCFGIMRGRRDVEVAGLILLTGAFASFFIAICAYKFSTLPTVLYVPALAIGAALRARFISTAHQVVVT